jgi:phosphomannomutase
MRRKVIAFDLDGTLAPSKSPLPDRMGAAIDQLLETYHVCVISGGKFEQFKRQLLNGLVAPPENLARLHLLPTCGTRYYRYDLAAKNWQQVYAEDFTTAQKEKITAALKKVTHDLGFVEKQTWGEVIEDRGSQITWSALGQDIVEQLGEEGIRLKEAWDPASKKKQAMRDALVPLLSDFEVRVGGATSVDITKPGIDKAYGMKKLVEMLHIDLEEVYFIGDRLDEGGNDYPVKALGIDTTQIGHWQETALVVEAIISVS